MTTKARQLIDGAEPQSYDPVRAYHQCKLEAGLEGHQFPKMDQLISGVVLKYRSLYNAPGLRAMGMSPAALELWSFIQDNVVDWESIGLNLGVSGYESHIIRALRCAENAALSGLVLIVGRINSQLYVIAIRRPLVQFAVEAEFELTDPKSTDPKLNVP